MLSDGNADIAIMPEYNTHSLSGLIVSTPFATQPLYFISRDMDELPPPEALSSVTQLAAAMGEGSEAEARRRVKMFCAELGLAPKQVEILPSVRSTFSQLLCGGCYTIAPVERREWGLRFLPLPGAGARLVFVTPQGRISPWVSLFESFIRQRRLAP